MAHPLLKRALPTKMSVFHTYSLVFLKISNPSVPCYQLRWPLIVYHKKTFILKHLLMFILLMIAIGHTVCYFDFALNVKSSTINPLLIMKIIRIVFVTILGLYLSFGKEAETFTLVKSNIYLARFHLLHTSTFSKDSTLFLKNSP